MQIKKLKTEIKKVEVIYSIANLELDGHLISFELNELHMLFEALEDTSIANRIYGSDSMKHEKLHKTLENIGLINYSARGSFYATEKFHNNYDQLMKVLYDAARIS